MLMDGRYLWHIILIFLCLDHKNRKILMFDEVKYMVVDYYY